MTSVVELGSQLQLDFLLGADHHFHVLLQGLSGGSGLLLLREQLLDCLGHAFVLFGRFFQKSGLRRGSSDGQRRGGTDDFVGQHVAGGLHSAKCLLSTQRSQFVADEALDPLFHAGVVAVVGSPLLERVALGAGR